MFKRTNIIGIVVFFMVQESIKHFPIPLRKSLKVIAEGVFLVFVLFSLSFAEETMTITTYYPSPYGSYNELTTTGNTYLATSSGSRVGIGTSSPSYQLQLSTDSAAKPTTNTWTVPSDRRLKKNIKPLKVALDKMLKLHGVTYQWKEPEKFGNMAGNYMGLIGQEVEKVFPEWVGTDKDGYKNLTVGGFEALTAEAIRELKAENDALKARIKALEARL